MPAWNGAERAANKAEAGSLAIIISLWRGQKWPIKSFTPNPNRFIRFNCYGYRFQRLVIYNLDCFKIIPFVENSISIVYTLKLINVETYLCGPSTTKLKSAGNGLKRIENLKFPILRHLSNTPLSGPQFFWTVVQLSSIFGICKVRLWQGLTVSRLYDETSATNTFLSMERIFTFCWLK